MNTIDEVKEYLLLLGAGGLSIGGIGLLFVGMYLTEFGWKGVVSVVSGIALVIGDTVLLLQRDSGLSNRLVDLIKKLLLST